MTTISCSINPKDISKFTSAFNVIYIVDLKPMRSLPEMRLKLTCLSTKRPKHSTSTFVNNVVAAALFGTALLTNHIELNSHRSTLSVFGAS